MQLPGGKIIEEGDVFTGSFDVTLADEGLSIEEISFHAVSLSNAIAGKGYLIYSEPSNADNNPVKIPVILKSPFN